MFSLLWDEKKKDPHVFYKYFNDFWFYIQIFDALRIYFSVRSEGKNPALFVWQMMSRLPQSHIIE